MNRVYVVNYVEGGKRRKFKALLDVAKYGSKEVAARAWLDMGGSFNARVVSVKRPDVSSSKEGVGNPKNYK